MEKKRSNYTRLHNWYAEALSKLDGLPPVMRVHLQLMRMTFGYHTKEKAISLGDLVVRTGLKKTSVKRAVDKLIELGLIETKWAGAGKRTIALNTNKRKLKTLTRQAIEQPSVHKSDTPEEVYTNPAPPVHKSGTLGYTKPIPPRTQIRYPHVYKEKDLKEKKKLLKKEIPDWVDPEGFGQFAEWRKSIGKPLNEKNLSSFFSELHRILNGMWWRQQEVYDRCMARGWAMLTDPIERHHDPLMNYPPEERQAID